MNSAKIGGAASGFYEAAPDLRTEYQYPTHPNVFYT
ncbi:hypothetical protein EYZ11_013584 [Aspergillus tanneri]|uniref:Uncharacterized protein n=1 Tax=Aspergillus tanneri TaxID=1220188 RepID=A0A4S3IX95_9EURO|nr:hypothetical protein EYZ11_013584 [Aspergillus tanneri]